MSYRSRDNLLNVFHDPFWNSCSNADTNASIRLLPLSPPLSATYSTSGGRASRGASGRGRAGCGVGVGKLWTCSGKSLENMAKELWRKSSTPESAVSVKGKSDSMFFFLTLCFSEIFFFFLFICVYLGTPAICGRFKKWPFTCWG